MTIKFIDSLSNRTFDIKPIESLADEREQMIQYLFSKFMVEDWHAVCDAGMDLREIDAKIKFSNEELAKIFKLTDQNNKNEINLLTKQVNELAVERTNLLNQLMEQNTGSNNKSLG